MCSTSIFPCIMTMVPNSVFSFFICSMFLLSLPLYISLFYMLLNDNIVNIEKPDGICSLTFVLNTFSLLFLHPSIFSIEHSRPA